MSRRHIDLGEPVAGTLDATVKNAIEIAKVIRERWGLVVTVTFVFNGTRLGVDCESDPEVAMSQYQEMRRLGL